MNNKAEDADETVSPVRWCCDQLATRAMRQPRVLPEVGHIKGRATSRAFTIINHINYHKVLETLLKGGMSRSAHAHRDLLSRRTVLTRNSS